MLEALKQFLIYAKLNSYANSQIEYSLTSSNTKKIILEKDNFIFVDEYIGYNPFSGIEIVFYKNKPLWQLHYYGSTSSNPKIVYNFLKFALSNINRDLPLRGPTEISRNNLSYQFNVEGDLSYFKGEEFILENSKIIYSCLIFGGLVK